MSERDRQRDRETERQARERESARVGPVSLNSKVPSVFWTAWILAFSSSAKERKKETKKKRNVIKECIQTLMTDV